MPVSTRRRIACPLLLAIFVLSPTGRGTAAEGPPDGVVELFNGKDLRGWVNVNGARSTWSVRDGLLVGTGLPSGFLRTETMHGNYVLELEWRIAGPGGNSGLLLHADALPQVGAPYPRSVEAEILDGNHGSIFGIRGCKVVPLTNPRARKTTDEARPLEERCNAVGQWNRYVLTSKDGALSLEVNGETVTRVEGCSLRMGYIGLQSETGEVHFRKVRLKALPGAAPPADQVARADEGFRSIFDGVSFAGWQYRGTHEGQWEASDGVVRCTGEAKPVRGQDRSLWTDEEYGDFVMSADWRLPKKPELKALPIFTPDGLFARDDRGKTLRREIPDAGDSGIFLRGEARSQVNIWSQPMGSGDINEYHKDEKLPAEIRRACLPRTKADHAFGEWNRFVITMRGDRVSVVLNGEAVIEGARLPGVPARGRIALQDHTDPVEFRNLFLKPLD